MDKLSPQIEKCLAIVRSPQLGQFSNLFRMLVGQIIAFEAVDAIVECAQHC